MAEERKWVNDICVDGLQETLRQQKIEEFNTADVDHSKIIKGITVKANAVSKIRSLTDCIIRRPK